jgi:Fe-S-cluster containining protein
MCCDGTLFDGVKLEPGDDAKRLRALGLPVKFARARKPVGRFAQPCAALCADRTCRVYAERPGQCRTFECGVFKKAKAGELDPAAALRLVRRGRRLGDRVRKLLRELGDTDEHRALGERFFRMQCRMEEEQPAAAALARFADLSLVVHQLKLLTQERFYTRSADSSAPPRALEM